MRIELISILSKYSRTLHAVDLHNLAVLDRNRYFSKVDSFQCFSNSRNDFPIDLHRQVCRLG